MSTLGTRIARGPRPASSNFVADRARRRRCAAASSQAPRLRVACAATDAEDGVLADKYKKPPFPFVCITGQDAMKRSLLVNAVDPAVGGVILLGDRGTGKSIAVKAMADIMPVCGAFTNLVLLSFASIIFSYPIACKGTSHMCTSVS